MVHLCLSEPTWNDDGGNDSAENRIALLSDLESVLWSLIKSGGRSEARLWLCNTISGIRSISPHNKCQLFMSLLRTKPFNQSLASQLLQMIIEKRPHKAGHIIAKKSHLLERFFAGNPRCIFQWFSTSAAGDGMDLGKGAKALTKFAFVNRDICWEELEWKGKHGQSPAMVATKPHYFLDLDIQQTVENFIENVPEFWSSKEFSESVADGGILSLDKKYFVDLFVDLIHREDSEDVWEVIGEFLMEESFLSLCQHLLIILREHDLCVFLELLHKYVEPKVEPKSLGDPSCWFEIILSKYSTFESIDELIFLNGVISQRRQLLRLVRDEEFQEEQAKVKDIVLQICEMSNDSNSFYPFFKECLNMKTKQVIKLLGLQSWVHYYTLSENCWTSESWESLFIRNGIGFRRSDKFALLHNDRSSEENDSDVDDRLSARVRHKRKEKRRKKKRRRMNMDHGDEYKNELLDFDYPIERRGSNLETASWLLSTDAYSTSWSTVDLPDHLSKHCFSAWMEWIFSKRGRVC